MSNLPPFPRRTSPTPRRGSCSKVNVSRAPAETPLPDLSCAVRPSSLGYPKRTFAYGEVLVRSSPEERACRPLPVGPTVGLSQIASCLTTALMLRDFEM